MTPTRLALASLALTLSACSREDMYSDATFTENVYAAYAECDEQEIKFLATMHNVQLAFDACGSNRFAWFNWSPDGTDVYFQLTHGGHVMDGEKKTIAAVPTETPVANATWLRQDLLAVPIAPADATTTNASGEKATREAEDAQGPYRLALYDQAARTLNVVELPLRQPRDQQPYGAEGKLVLTGLGEDGARRPYTFDPSTGEVSRLAPWLEQPVERFVYTPQAGLLTWSNGEDTEIMRIEDGSSVHVLKGVLRAIPHPEGRYVALETLGAAISLFDQRTWHELSPEARERELARKEEWLKRLPEWAPREANPPEIQILDLQTSRRYRIDAFYGDQFEWYRPRNYYCSFILWGIEGKQLHRNVALTDIAERLRMADKGEPTTGIVEVKLDGTPLETAEASANPDGSDPAY